MSLLLQTHLCPIYSPTECHPVFVKCLALKKLFGTLVSGQAMLNHRVPVSFLPNSTINPYAKRIDCWEITDEAFNVDEHHFVHPFYESFPFTSVNGDFMNSLMKAWGFRVGISGPCAKTNSPSSSSWSEEWHLNFLFGDTWITDISLFTAQVVSSFCLHEYPPAWGSGKELINCLLASLGSARLKIWKLLWKYI